MPSPDASSSKWNSVDEDLTSPFYPQGSGRTVVNVCWALFLSFFIPLLCLIHVFPNLSVLFRGCKRKLLVRGGGCFFSFFFRGVVARKVNKPPVSSLGNSFFRLEGNSCCVGLVFGRLPPPCFASCSWSSSKESSTFPTVPCLRIRYPTSEGDRPLTHSLDYIFVCFPGLFFFFTSLILS